MTETMAAAATEHHHHHHRDRDATTSKNDNDIVGREKEKRLLQTAFTKLLKTSNAAAAAATPDAAASAQHRPARYSGRQSHGQHHPPPSSPDAKSLVLISGHSGTGKSALSLHHQQQWLEHAFVGDGKFDLHQIEEPYHGIKTAMKQLCSQMKELPSESFKQIQQLLRQGLASGEVQTLSKMMPELHKLVPSFASSSSSSLVGGSGHDRRGQGRQGPRKQLSVSSTSNSTEGKRIEESATTTTTATGGGGVQGGSLKEMSDRLRFALRRFIQIVSKFRPVVLVVDDIQWADKASIDMIESWLLDSQISSFMVIGCYRVGTIEQNRTVRETLDQLKECKRERLIKILEISLGDLSVGHVEEILRAELAASHPNSTNGLGTETASKNSEGEISAQSNSSSFNDLADIVHKKTGGNPFFVRQFIRSLIGDGQIYFDANDTNAWQWDAHDIITKSLAPTNIIEYMKHKLHNLEAARIILPVAACMGSNFSRRAITVAIRGLSIHSHHSSFFRPLMGISRILSDSEISHNLRKCHEEGLIVDYYSLHHQSSNADSTSNSSTSGSCNESNASLNKDGSESGEIDFMFLGKGSQKGDHSVFNRKHKRKSFRFMHDKVQEASLALIPDDQLSELKYRIGEILMSGLPKDEFESKLFTITNLINARTDLVPTGKQSEERRMQIVNLNYKAGQDAVQSSAFHSAMKYFNVAIELLPEGHWDSHFKESVDIYSAAAECAHASGDTPLLRSLCSQIVELEECSILHKSRVYNLLIDVSLQEAQESNDCDTVGLCLSVLKKLGCNFPKTNVGRTFSMLRGIMRTRRSASKWTAKWFAEQPLATDEQEIAVIRTLDLLSTAAYLTMPDFLPLAVLKSINRTAKFGIAPFSPPAFAFQGMILGYFMGDFQAGKKFAEIAVSMLDIEACRVSASRTALLVYFMTMHWTTPIESTLDMLMEGFRMGMSTGDVESAAWNIQSYLQSHYLLGTMPLKQLDQEYATYTKIMKDFGQVNQAEMACMGWQVIQNFQGLSTSPGSKLIGDVFDERVYLERASTEIDPVMILSITGNSMIAATYLGDYEIGARFAIKTHDDRLKKLPGLNSLPPCTFAAGFCCYAMINDSSDANGVAMEAKQLRLHTKYGDRYRKKLKEWVDKGSPNCVHTLRALEAEHEMLYGRYHNACILYEKAIGIAATRGFMNDQALFNERLAICMLKKEEGGKELDDALRKLDEAIRLNIEWGATSKADALKVRREEWRRI